MFDRLFKRGKPRVFLGTLSVEPRRDFKRHIDQHGVFQSVRLEGHLRNMLEEIFALPPAPDATEAQATDLALDVHVPSFQSGQFLDVSLSDFGFVLFWRPRITVQGRLYVLRSGRTKRTYAVTKKMPWREFFGRQLTWRAISGWKPTFDTEDMNRHLAVASHTLLDKLRRAT